MHKRPALMCLLYKVAEHLLGHFEVSDHTVLQWFDDSDFAAQHFSGLSANCLHLTGTVVKSNG